MQKMDIVKIAVGMTVSLNRNGKVYQGRVLRLPLLNKSTLEFEKGHRPTQFKLEVFGDDEYSGNRYVSFTAVHTAEVDKAQKARAEAEAKAKLNRKVEAETKAMAKEIKEKVAQPKTTVSQQLLALAKMAEIAEKAGLELDLSQFKLC